MSMFIQVTSPDPTVASIFDWARSRGRPTTARVRTTGGTPTPKVDDLIAKADKEFDNDKRADYTHQIGQFIP